jgi:hypothetical protein
MSDVLKQWLVLCKSGSVQEIKDYHRKHGEEIIKEIVRLKNAGVNNISEIERLHTEGGDK